MAGGAEIVHAARFLVEGSVGAVVGLIVGVWAAPPRHCHELGSSGLFECTNKVGQEFLSASTTPWSAEWIGALAGFVVVGAVVGWAFGAAWRTLTASPG